MSPYFRILLSFGQRWQNWWIQNHAKATSIEVPEGKFSEYDAVVDGVRYEFKAETLIAKYGNVCIEYKANGKPSGIAVTTAEYYVIMSIDKDECIEWWRVPVYVIKEKIAAGLYNRDMHGGYKSLSQFYLFKKDVFDAWRGA